jgi:hypothetical protein
MNNLKKRHIIIVDRCCMCKKSGKSVDRLLLHFEIDCSLERYLQQCRGASLSYVYLSGRPLHMLERASW